MSKFISVPTKGLIFKEWLYAKTKIVPIIIGFSLFSIFTVLMLEALPYLVDLPPEIFPEFDGDAMMQSNISNGNSIFSIIAVILCADAIAGEREKNTLVLIQTKPIKISTIIIVKALIRYSLVAIGTIISSVIVYLVISIMKDVPTLNTFLLSIFLLLITLFSYVCLGMLISTFTRTQLSAGGISIGIVFFITTLSSFFIQEKVLPYNAFQLASNIFLQDFDMVVIVLNCLFLSVLGWIFLLIAIIKYYSEQEPTRKR